MPHVIARSPLLFGHCEERSDEAILYYHAKTQDCHALRARNDGIGYGHCKEPLLFGHCEEPKATRQSAFVATGITGLLRFARNDQEKNDRNDQGENARNDEAIKSAMTD
jgi:hypothetical protein